MKLFCLVHLPTGKVCDMGEGECFSTFTSDQAGRDYIARTIDAKWQGNYDVVTLPEGIKPASEPISH